MRANTGGKLLAKVLTQTDIPSDIASCWMWSGQTTKIAGNNVVPSRISTDGGNATSVRGIIWEGFRTKTVPERIYLTCGNGLCLNPAHLTNKRSADGLDAKRVSEIVDTLRHQAVLRAQVMTRRQVCTQFKVTQRQLLTIAEDNNVAI